MPCLPLRILVWMARSPSLIGRSEAPGGILTEENRTESSPPPFRRVLSSIRRATVPLGQLFKSRSNNVQSICGGVVVVVVCSCVVEDDEEDRNGNSEDDIVVVVVLKEKPWTTVGEVLE
jgi:hypothetical protein